MEGKLNYTLVGLFVALLIAAAIVTLLWLSGHDKKQQFNLYHVYVTESVTGLNANSTVKYLGVDVGTVSSIEINSENTQQVAIELKIKQGVPIKTDTVATLKFFGITGLAFIELSGSHNDAPLLASSNNALPIIPYKHSTFKRIEESIDTIVKKTTEVLDRIDRLMGDENLHNISTLLKQSTLLIEDLQVSQKHFDTLIDEGIKVGKSVQQTLDTFNSDVIEQTLTKIGAAADSIDTMADTFSDSGKVMEQNVSDTLKHISAASDSVEKLVTNFGQEYSGVGEKVGNNVDESLRAFRQLLYQLDNVAGDMQRAIDSIEDSPSDLLFKSSKPKLGPGEG